MSLISAQQLDELNRQLMVLRDYSQALQSQNKTRNQQRIILEKQIQRLTNIQKQFKSTNINTSIKTNTTVNCLQCAKYKSEILKLQNTIQRLKRQNSNIQSSYNVLSDSLSKYTIMGGNSVNKSTTARTQYSMEGSNVTLGTVNSKDNEIQKKYKYLTTKFDEINLQNLSLKRQIEQQSKYNAKKLQQTMVKIQSQKQSLNIKVSTLQLQIHNLKSLLSCKQNQIFSYKNKQSSLSAAELELKAVKDSLASRDKQILSLKQKINGYCSLQYDLRNTKGTLVTKQGQNAGLKDKIIKLQQQNVKIYPLQTQLRNLKYQITIKDSQIQAYKNTSADLNTAQLSRINSLQSQIKTNKSLLSAKDTEISSLHSQLSQLSTLKYQNLNLQSQLKIIQQKYQLIQKQQKIVSTIQPINTQQITSLNQLIKHLRIQLQDKEIYIRQIEDQLKQMTNKDQLKNIQVKKLDEIVNSYVQKIGQLEIQLNRLQKNSHNNTVNHLNMQANNQIEILSQQNRILNQKIYDLQRRILILQDTNRNLRQQLRVSIEMRNRESSRLAYHSQQQTDVQLSNTIKLLKIQLQDLRKINNKIKSDNQYLQAKLSSTQLQIQHLIGFSKVSGLRSNRNIKQKQSNNNKILANMPIIQTSKMYSSHNPNRKTTTLSNKNKDILYEHTYTVLDQGQRDPLTSTLKGLKNMPTVIRSSEPVRQSLSSNSKMRLHQKQSKSKLRNGMQKNQQRIIQTNIGNTNNINNTNYSKANTINISSIGNKNITGNLSNMSNTNNNKQADQLQRKIEMLKQQNKGLRKHLYQVGH